MDYQGYDYETVQIGEQCWFAENLRSANYENGDLIPANLNDSEWENASSGAVAIFGEGEGGCFEVSIDGDACDEAWSLHEYGRLYNWFAVDDTRGLCPNDWHVPSNEEWTTMTDYLGGASAAGGDLRASYGWPENGNGSNLSGFSGLPGGYRLDWILRWCRKFWKLVELYTRRIFSMVSVLVARVSTSEWSRMGQALWIFRPLHPRLRITTCHEAPFHTCSPGLCNILFWTG